MVVHLTVTLKHNTGERLFTVFCGGVLISRSAVLTAAHCLNFSRFTSLRVSEIEERFGVESFETYDDEISMLGYCVLSNYTDLASDEAINDLAVKILANSIEFTKNIQPTCI